MFPLDISARPLKTGICKYEDCSKQTSHRDILDFKVYYLQQNPAETITLLFNATHSPFDEALSMKIRTWPFTIRSPKKCFFLGILCWSLLAIPLTAQMGGYGRRGFGGGNYASTAQQGADYGMASMMRAQGYQNLQNSQAAQNYQTAQSQQIDNRKKWTDTYFDMRKTNRKARADEAPSRISHEDAIRLAKSVAPPRLSSTQLDPTTGHIQYPLVLQDSIFTPYRSELDSLFAGRASSGSGLQIKDFQAIRTTLTKFKEVLKAHVQDYPSSEYGKARVFLNSLSNEANFPAG